MAGAGYKLFNTGDVLTAQQVNEYLMQQTVMVFANAAARTTALSGVLAEGMVTYLADTNVVEIYTGAAWVSLDDPNAIQNSLLTTTGDTIYASSASTPARLGIGTAGQVLTVAGGVPTWATPAGSTANWSLLNAGGTALTGASTITVSGISGRNRLMVIIENASSASGNSRFSLRLNSVSTSTYTTYEARLIGTATYSAGIIDRNGPSTTSEYGIVTTATNASSQAIGWVNIDGCNTAGQKMINSWAAADTGGGTGNQMGINCGFWNNTATVTSVSLLSGAGNFDNGTMYVYATNN